MTVRSRLFKLGVNVSKQSHPADVLSLIRKLHPIDAGIPLIRLGSAGEGGYLIPDDLEGIEYCFSPGVSNIADFENDLADRGIHCFLADASVEGPPIVRPEFTFDKKFLGALDDKDKFITLQAWKDKYLQRYTGDMILQMDIEGHEYPVILTAPDELLDQFRIIVVEFHDVRKLFDPLDLILFSAVFEKLLKSFYVVHNHPNNSQGCDERGGVEVPNMLEMTFLNKRRVKAAKPATQFPHPLDAINSVSRKPVPLPKCWYA